ncbi:DUF2513 domain-containing protein [Staphylococcus pseudintermedius]|uniref:DUF2513 domain-containing protein n=1 Tax=Staphylococcus TaxID=1279 RepID=UPI000E68B8F3|nr:MULTISPECIES: DUF2513 domain-containing protein [Staphylococcus]EGQ1307255.1 DUF2513 domain-containing protein [Staphylococcus pseudintermedius]EGQ2725648.1 DUF2513 domain-containing protein [Staphylococcus pseudintermedius]EGQ2750301.1 DUF2513 domain-containing protein [Staphylococcus pseudintermedius]EGQ3139996.1 DUF2513 domain-containing protein [Staphylococcus pseudintermedius]EGQ3257292.1 DUF2513 domain-containing protein [Staphylococcus pseudintermedius]
MELKYELVREVLLIVQNKKNMRDYLSLEDITSEVDIEKYTKDDVEYTILKTTEANLLDSQHIFGFDSSQYLIGHLTFEGHEFLNSVKDKDVWEETKKRASKVESLTLPVLQQLAVSVLNQYLGINN